MIDAAAFLRLVREGELDRLRQALATQPELVNAVGPHPSWGGRPQPLHVAIETKQMPVFELLLEAGADVNGTNGEYGHWSPLMLGHGHEEVRRRLIAAGARIGVAEALLMGMDARLPEALPLEVPNGGSWLAHARTPAAIDRLVALGAPLDAPDDWGTTPMAALSKVSLALVEHLRGYGVEPSPEDLARLNDRACAPASPVADSVLMAAVGARQLALVDWLLTERGGNVNARAADRSRQTLLHEAAWNGDLAMVQLLVGAGADVTLLDEEHQSTPLHWAETAIEVAKRESCREVVAWLRLVRIREE